MAETLIRMRIRVAFRTGADDYQVGDLISVDEDQAARFVRKGVAERLEAIHVTNVSAVPHRAVLYDED